MENEGINQTELNKEFLQLSPTNKAVLIGLSVIACGIGAYFLYTKSPSVQIRKYKRRPRIKKPRRAYRKLKKQKRKEKREQQLINGIHIHRGNKSDITNKWSSGCIIL
jgi:hypothetical protein